MRGTLRGRSVLITGAAGGLGRTMAAELASAGARLLLVDLDAAGLDRVGARTGAEVLVADIADPDGRRRIVEAWAGAGPDILINNAGIEKAGGYDGLDAEEVRHAMEVNLVGSMLLAHAVLPAMRARHSGHIITVASMAAMKPIPFNAVYNTAKSGLVAFSISLSKELAGTGVFATVVCPSAVTGVGMWARASDQLGRHRLVEASTVAPGAVVSAVLRAIEKRPVRVLVGSPLVRAGALLSAVSPWFDRATDRISGIRDVYRERIDTDSGRRL